MTEILALNVGSSSLKYAVFDGDTERARGSVEGAGDAAIAVATLLDRLAAPPGAVGHRLVHGGPDHVAPARVDPALRARLERLVPLSPLHLPGELAALDAAGARLPGVPQIVCFDTAFHRTLPAVAQRLPVPDALHGAGVRRYGFHGLSYASIVSALVSAVPVERRRRAVIAHLGSGASMAAIRDGRSVETTMGFSPAGGLVMATRTGDLDPGVLIYLLDHGHDARLLERLVHQGGGLAALSGTTGDMRRLLAERARDPRAQLAVDVFCYHARQAIGALTAVLGGIDTLVFTGGIGERAAAVRAEICDDLGYLGIAIDDAANAASAAVISTGRCEVRVMRTDEEREIARAVRGMLGERAPA